MFDFFEKVATGIGLMTMEKKLFLHETIMNGLMTVLYLTMTSKQY